MLFLALSQSCNKPTVTPAWNFSNYSTYFPHFSSLRSDFRPLVEPKRDNWTNTGFFWSFTTFILGQELQDKMFWYLSTAGKYAACFWHPPKLCVHDCKGDFKKTIWKVIDRDTNILSFAKECWAQLKYLKKSKKEIQRNTKKTLKKKKQKEIWKVVERETLSRAFVKECWARLKY